MTEDREPRRLVLLRHGKSAYPPGVPDHERPLAPRGERQATLAGAWIRDNLPPVDRVLCSTAQRTRQTAIAAGLAAPTEYSQTIYGAYPDELLDLVHVLPDVDSTVVLIGHAPGLPDLAEDLAGPGSDSVALSRVRTKFPTSAIAVITVRGAWSDAQHSAAALAACVVPRD